MTRKITESVIKTIIFNKKKEKRSTEHKRKLFSTQQHKIMKEKHFVFYFFENLIKHCFFYPALLLFLNCRRFSYEVERWKLQKVSCWIYCSSGCYSSSSVLEFDGRTFRNVICFLPFFSSLYLSCFTIIFTETKTLYKRELCGCDVALSVLFLFYSFIHVLFFGLVSIVVEPVQIV